MAAATVDALPTSDPSRSPASTCAGGNHSTSIPSSSSSCGSLLSRRFVASNTCRNSSQKPGLA